MVIFVQSKMVAMSHMWNWALEMWLVPLRDRILNLVLIKFK